MTLGQLVASLGYLAVFALIAAESLGVPLPGRTYAAFLAGVNRMRWHRFVIANASGGIVWAAAYTLAGYLAGAALQRASGTIALVTGLVAVGVIIAAIIMLRRRKAVLAKHAGEAYPGPLPEE